MKIINIFVLLILLSTLLSYNVDADTGKYILDREYVDLYINTDTNVEIKYEITMSVTDGNIPWVTVGLPNSKYSVLEFGGNAKSCKSDNFGSWTGVRVDLDKTYYKGDSFSFWFKANQKGFVHYYKDNRSSIQFAPCWWDRAVTTDLKVVFHLPNEVKDVTTTASGATFGNSTVTWQWSNVPQGTKHTVGMIMPLDAFPSLKESEQTGASGGDMMPFFWLIVFIFAMLIIGGLFLSFNRTPEITPTRRPYVSPSINVSGKEKRKRHINMKCPKDGSLLKKRKVKGITVDFCEKCGGSFFDKGEIEKLFRKKVTGKQLDINDIKTFAIIPEMKNVCPRCEGELKKVTREEHTIYACEDCKGIWMDHGLYDVIRKKLDSQLEQARQRIERAGGRSVASRSDYYDDDHFYFYPWIYYHVLYSRPSAPRTSSSSRSSSSSSYSSCACVSCACVASCACACACAGGGAAGCAPKSKAQINFEENK